MGGLSAVRSVLSPHGGPVSTFDKFFLPPNCEAHKRRVDEGLREGFSAVKITFLCANLPATEHRMHEAFDKSMSVVLVMKSHQVILEVALSRRKNEFYWIMTSKPSSEAIR